MNYYIEVFKKYAVLRGRASRKEFWTFTLINLMVGVVAGAMSANFLVKAYANIQAGKSFDSDMGWLKIGLPILILLAVYLLIIIIPSICVLVRRLHDTNRGGGWCFLFYPVWILSRMPGLSSRPILMVVSIVVSIVWLVFTLSDSQPGSNKYGPNPKER